MLTACMICRDAQRRALFFWPCAISRKICHGARNWLLCNGHSVHDWLSPCPSHHHTRGITLSSLQARGEVKFKLKAHLKGPER